MKKFKEFPKIGQFRQTIKSITDRVRYKGKDENENPIFAKLPTVKFEGTVKLHGTNAGIIKSGTTHYCQSRNEILNYPQKDNAGFALFVYRIPEVINELFKTIAENNENVSIYGEWCGGNIQKGVGINGLEKMFVIFAVKVEDFSTDEYFSKWIDINPQIIEQFNKDNIYHIKQFPHYEIEIDFNNPAESQNKLIELTNSVEKQCPVAKYFGKEGVGEGIVWKGITLGWTSSRYWFKVKGEKHSTTKVKKLANIDTEKLENVKKFVEYAVTENRLNQALENVVLDIKKIGEFIRWILNDVMKEESDTMANNNLTKQDVGGTIAKVAKEWFFKKINEEVGL